MNNEHIRDNVFSLNKNKKVRTYNNNSVSIKMYVKQESTLDPTPES